MLATQFTLEHGSLRQSQKQLTGGSFALRFSNPSRQMHTPFRTIDARFRLVWLKRRSDSLFRKFADTGPIPDSDDGAVDVHGGVDVHGIG